MNNKTDQNTTVLEIRKTVEDFCKTRDWENNDPKQLLLSMSIELAELAEHFQWSKDKEWPTDQDIKKQLTFEAVDIVFYLSRFLNKIDVDFSSSFFEKVEKLNKKYPPVSIHDLDKDHYQKVKEEYRKTGKNKLYE